MKRKRFVTIGLIFTLLSTCLTPGFAQSKAEGLQVAGEGAVDTTQEWVIDYRLKENTNVKEEPNKIPALTLEQMQEIDWGNFSVSTVQQINETYDRSMLLIAAYFYPRLRHLLSIEEKREQNKWNRKTAVQKYEGLTSSKKQQLDNLTPIKDEIAPIEETNEAATLVSTLATTTKFTETQLENVYSKRLTTKPVDDFYRTANLLEEDLSLQGKNGMDLKIIRQYNSLDSKTQVPTLEYDGADDQWSNEKEKKLFVNEYLPFAKGWSFNIPTFEYSQVIKEASYYGNERYHYNYDEELFLEETDRYLITLDDGNTIQYEIEDRQEKLNSPYKNVEVIPHADTDDLDVEVDGYLYEFRKSGDTQRITKTNVHGDKIIYTLSKDKDDKNVVEIKDTYGRYIVMERDNVGAIQTLKVFKNATDKSNDANPIIQLNYEIEYSSSSDPENSTYSQLNSVTQVNDNESKVLATYQYDTMSSEFNLLMDYTFHEDDLRNMAFEMDSYLDKDYENRRKTLSYLNLTDVTYPISGLSYHYYYENYDDAPTDPRNRGVIRLYQDHHALTYISYRPVVEVDIEYNEYGTNTTDSTGITYTLSDLGDLKTWEIWKSPQNQDPTLDRLYYVEERHGHLVASTEYRSGQQITSLYEVNKDGNPLLKRTTTRHRLNSTFPVFTAENGSQTYSYTPVRHVSYAYVPENKSTGARGRTKPAYMYEFVENNANETVINYLLNPKLSATGTPPVTGLSNYANITSFIYDETYGDLKKITTPDGVSVSYTYLSNGLYNYRMLTSVTKQSSDAMLVEKTTYNDTDGDYLVDSEVTTHKYVREGSSITDQVTRAFTYDLNDQIRTITETASDGSSLLTENNAYDPYGHVTKQTLRSISLGNEVKDLVSLTSYVSGLDIVDKHTYPDGSNVDYDYDVLNRLTKETFTNGSDVKETTYTYDDNVRKVTKALRINGQTDPYGLHLINYYTPYGDVAYSAEVSSEGERPLVQNDYELEPYGMKLEKTITFGDEDRTIAYEYYADDRLKTVTDEEGKVTTYLYANTMTSSGKVLPQMGEYVIHPNGLKSLQLYNNKGQLILSDEKNGDGKQNRRSTFTYDGLGNPTSKTISNHNGSTRVWTYNYDCRNQLVYLKDAENNTYRYQYDHRGNLTGVTENGLQTTKNEYNELGWRTKEVSAPSGETETTTYLVNGDINTFTDKAGNKRIYRYTPFYEIDQLSVFSLDGQLRYSENFTYDPRTRLLQGESNSDGQTITYTYDSYQRPATFNTFKRTYTLAYTDKDSTVDSLTYPDGSKVNYSYDNKGRLLSVDTPNMGKVVYTYSSSTNGNEYGIKYPNGLTSQKTFNSFGEVQKTTFNKNGNSIFKEARQYDGFGNVSGISKVTPSASETSSYQYDKIDRLKTETSQTTGQKSYSYDKRGNRETFEGPLASFPQAHTLKYDVLNRVKSFTNSESGRNLEAVYTYYPGGLRASKNVNGEITRYVYWNGRIIEELDGANQSKAKNIWGNELLYREIGGSSEGQKKGFYLTNGHGDVIHVVNEMGDIINSYDYDSWGNILFKEEGMNNPFTYTGEVYDKESNLYYLRARYYDPSVGRFISEDTNKGQVDNPLTLNRYTYVHNNPIRYYDPTGNAAAEMPAGGGGGGIVLPMNSKEAFSILTFGIISGATAPMVAQQIKATDKAKPVAVPIESTQNNNKKKTVIYRLGSDSPWNMTPKQKDLTCNKTGCVPGLSFTLDKPQSGSYVETTVEDVFKSSAGQLVALNDYGRHVSVFPVTNGLFDYGKLEGWVNTLPEQGINPQRDSAIFNTNRHEWSSYTSSMLRAIDSLDKWILTSIKNGN